MIQDRGPVAAAGTGERGRRVQGIRGGAAVRIAVAGALVTSALTLGLAAAPSDGPLGARSATAATAPACLRRTSGFQASVPFTLTTARGTASLTWNHRGDPNVRSYRVGAVPQVWAGSTQPATTWTTVTAPADCAVRDLTARFPRLTSGGRYTFVLDVVVLVPAPSGTAYDRTVERTVATSTGVRIP